MSLDALTRWLGLGTAALDETDAPLRDLLDVLDHLEPARARYLARFACLLGRIAHADHRVSPEERATMEAIVAEEGGLGAGQASVVVGLAQSANRLFGGTADFEIARDFAEAATYDEKLALVRCLFRVAATDGAITVSEEAEIHRIAGHLKIQPRDLTALRVAHRQYLPGLSGSG